MKLTEAKLKQLIVEMMDDPLADKASKVDSLLSGSEEEANQGIELLMVIVEMFPDANKSPAMRQVAMKHYKNLQSELKELDDVINDDYGYMRFIYKRVDDAMEMDSPNNWQNSNWQVDEDMLMLNFMRKFPKKELIERHGKLLSAIQVFVDNFFYE
jgi:predicted RNA-binding protein Jag